MLVVLLESSKSFVESVEGEVALKRYFVDEGSYVIEMAFVDICCSNASFTIDDSVVTIMNVGDEVGD